MPRKPPVVFPQEQRLAGKRRKLSNAVVARDAGFKDSAVKINVEQIFKLLSPSTEVKSI
ncbi:hypothetical protein [Cephaloticoccus capnophilus]|uniref:hypothetical protein n=1 Tax=Cephaloticoccus capnophilus TaxID=1548208 RepID=UPI000B1990A5|nr:hypothetical protein [Cephaloticoccus capnophilus]